MPFQTNSGDRGFYGVNRPEKAIQGPHPGGKQFADVCVLQNMHVPLCLPIIERGWC
jgi:hypothetical protein